MINADPQDGLSDWWQKREAETPSLAKDGARELPATLARCGERGARLAVIDTPPAMTEPLSGIIEAPISC